MYELEGLRRDHEAAVLEFELANRMYFARSINDRGDEFFEDFPQRHSELVAEQENGLVACYVLVGQDEKIVGRFNLYDLTEQTANVGYRVAERVAGRGVATAGLRDLCRTAGDELGLQKLTAIVGNENGASRRVLEKIGFVVVGPTEIAGREASAYELTLAKPGPLT